MVVGYYGYLILNNK